MSPPSFESLLAALARGGVDFMLVEGLAVALCGFQRATFDVDVLVEDSKQNLERLLKGLVMLKQGSLRPQDRLDVEVLKKLLREEP